MSFICRISYAPFWFVFICFRFSIISVFVFHSLLWYMSVYNYVSMYIYYIRYIWFNTCIFNSLFASFLLCFCFWFHANWIFSICMRIRKPVCMCIQLCLSICVCVCVCCLNTHVLCFTSDVGELLLMLATYSVIKF